jgi:hypothetical protein
MAKSMRGKDGRHVSERTMESAPIRGIGRSGRLCIPRQGLTHV